MGGLPFAGGFGGFFAPQCFAGRVNLFRFIQPPAPGTVIGELGLRGGRSVPLVESRPAPFGGVSLAAVDGRFAFVCGLLTIRVGRLVLDVRRAVPIQWGP